MVSLSTLEHTKNNSYKRKKNAENSLNNNSNGGAITRCELFLFKK